MRKRSILFIGSGVGGLATGCYAQVNGYQATILEMHTTPGGLCTSWKRGGYTFDGCIHNLAGTAPTVHSTTCGGTWASCQPAKCGPLTNWCVSNAGTARHSSSTRTSTSWNAI